MSFLKRLFAAPDVIEKTVDGVYRGVDKAWFTPEERAEVASQAQMVYKEMWMAAVPSAVSRRILMCIVAASWLIMALTTFFLYIFGDAAAAGFAYTLLRDVVNEPFMIIVGFYFLKSGLIDPLANAYKAKNGKE